MKTMNEKIVEIINQASGLLITAGAGMGVDSGLPDFRGSSGFWKEYPVFKDKLSFSQVASPNTFRNSPELAWGFYGHRYDLYKKTIPHDGFKLLLEIATKKFNNNYFVVTSNVDGQFQKAGFSANKINEIHGNIFSLQCINACQYNIWNTNYNFNIDTEKCISKLIPKCPYCNEIARPNILMFNDGDWVYDKTQDEAFNQWVKDNKNIVVIEIGAGKTISSIRLISDDFKKSLIRINPREADIPHNKGVSLYMNGIDGIKLIHSLMELY